MRVEKSDSTFESFQIRKIKKSLLLAFDASGDRPPEIDPLVNRVASEVAAEPTTRVSSELIGTFVENELMASGFLNVARRFIKYRHDQQQHSELHPDSTELGKYIQVAKYSRHVNGQRESWPEIVSRTFEMHVKKFPDYIDSLTDVADYVYNMQVLPSMRCLQFGGDAIQKQNTRIYNCSFTHIDRPRVFQEIFYLLLCGCGVGFSVQWHHVDKLPALKRVSKQNVKHHIIADNIEGWSDAIGWLFDSFLKGYWIEFAYHEIRPEGAPLVTSGGQAPGHMALRRMLERVRDILLHAQGRQLRPLDCHDIICHIAECILSGGIRRSSLISLFSPEDTEMLYCKASGSFEPEKQNSHRQMANNSAVLLRESYDSKIFDRLISIADSNYGDPGFFFTNSLEYGTNPCGEIGLHPVINGYTGVAFCNLCEINCAKFESADDMMAASRAASVIGTLQAMYTSFPYLGAVTEQIAARDRLLGVSLMGMQNRPDLAFDPELQHKACTVACDTNLEWSEILGINAAQRVTTIKPGGTAPLAASADGELVGSGIHPHWARRYFHGITANPNEAPAAFLRNVNPHLFSVKPNGDLFIQFPIEAVGTCVTELDTFDFMNQIFSTYTNWIVPGTVGTISPGLTHNVSCTVTLRAGEKEQVCALIRKNAEYITAMSFVPDLIDTRFQYAPRQAVQNEADLARWNYLAREMATTDWSRFKESVDGTTRQLTAACVSGACEL